MTTTHPGGGDAAGYEILVRGRLDARWSAWFGGLVVTDEADGTTLIRVAPIDQAGLHGLLRQVRDAGLTLITVTSLGDDAGSAR